MGEKECDPASRKFSTQHRRCRFYITGYLNEVLDPY